MRWKKKVKTPTREGDERIVYRYLWLPITIDNETRWLEKAVIRQTAYMRHYLGVERPGYTSLSWRNYKFE